MLQQLSAEGVSPVVALLGDPVRTAEALEAAGIAVEVLPTPLPPAPSALRSLPSAVIHLRALIRRLEPDVMEGTEAIPAIALGLAARGRRHKGVVVYHRQHLRGRLRIHAASWLAARVTQRTIVFSEATRRAASVDDHTPLEHIEVARSGSVAPRIVPPEEVAATRDSLGIAESARVIGIVSRFRREKGLDIVLRALGSLRDIRDLHVVVAGEGPEQAALRELAARAPVPVHFVGHRDDVALWYALSNVIVIPSRRESFGRVATESMASARPVVASRVGGLVEAVVDGETGLLAPPDDPEALAAVLRTILADRELAARMGVAGRERYQSRFTITHMATARKRAWERALASVSA